jgi:hypothetical protein
MRRADDVRRVPARPHPGDGTFPGPTYVVVSVADVDLDAGRLTVYPPTVSSP